MPAQFKKTVWQYYKKNKRDLPWRRSGATPYQILVSEIMLQQTQVDRVIPKYKHFIKQFPTFAALARAKQKDVLIAWQGLGYNRRALNLKRTAESVWNTHNGRLPKETNVLIALPGIGSYTAGAIRAFAWNLPSTVIETNIRTAYLHHFFPTQKKVSDKTLLPLIEKTSDTKNPREWYAALMDYGAHLKRTLPNPSRKSAHHTTQSRFKGSLREARGAILKTLATKHISEKELQEKTGIEKGRLEKALSELEREGFIRKKRNSQYELA